MTYYDKHDFNNYNNSNDIFVNTEYDTLEKKTGRLRSLLIRLIINNIFFTPLNSYGSHNSISKNCIEGFLCIVKTSTILHHLNTIENANK